MADPIGQCPNCNRPVFPGERRCFCGFDLRATMAGWARQQEELAALEREAAERQHASAQGEAQPEPPATGDAAVAAERIAAAQQAADAEAQRARDAEAEAQRRADQQQAADAEAQRTPDAEAERQRRADQQQAADAEAQRAGDAEAERQRRATVADREKVAPRPRPLLPWRAMGLGAGAMLLAGLAMCQFRPTPPMQQANTPPPQPRPAEEARPAEEPRAPPAQPPQPPAEPAHGNPPEPAANQAARATIAKGAVLGVEISRGWHRAEALRLLIAGVRRESDGDPSLAANLPNWQASLLAAEAALDEQVTAYAATLRELQPTPPAELLRQAQAVQADPAYAGPAIARATEALLAATAAAQGGAMPDQQRLLQSLIQPP